VIHLENHIKTDYKYWVIESHYSHNAKTTAILIEAGITLMRENLRRRHPTADRAQIDTLLGIWLHREDDAIPGDTAGQVRIGTFTP